MLLKPPETEAVPDCCRGGLYSCLLPLGLFLLLCLAWPRVVGGEVFTAQWIWVPGLDLNLAFRLDGLSLLFGLIITMTGFSSPSMRPVTWPVILITAGFLYFCTHS